MSEIPANFDPAQVLEDGQDFDGLEYTEVRINRVKYLIASEEANLAEHREHLAELEEKKRKLLEGKAQ